MVNLSIASVLVAAMFAVVVGGIHLWGMRRRAQNIRRFQRWSSFVSDTQATPTWRRLPSAAALIVAVFCSALVGASGIAAVDVNDEDARPNVIVIVDSSKSMFAEDVAASRLHEASRQLNGVVARIPAARIGIVTFAGEVSVMCPLTVDREAAAEALASIENAPASGRGSALAPALDRAIEAFGTSEGEQRILLVSDGEDTGSNLEPTIARLRERHVRVDAIGVGTIAGTSVPITRGSSVQGSPVMTALNEPTLTSIASQTGGEYFRLSDQQPDLEQRLQAVFGEPARSRFSGARNSLQLLVLVSFVLLGLDAALRAFASRMRRTA
jgi:Ca-activated chloride channel family protein